MALDGTAKKVILVFRANNDLWRLVALGPFDEAQENIVVRVVELSRDVWCRSHPRAGLPHEPGAWSVVAMVHSGDIEEPVERLHLLSR